ncbi:MAG TPA: AgmX/PglI C-terminal domain-containing protein, partial [Polyangia bacterium]|nr:AgmX/PglI C-terminal domain-containing protein [Polyangia bacterium]
APPGGRRPTGPVAHPTGLAAAASAPEPAGLDLDPSSMLETPGPQPEMLHDLGTNGVAHGEASASNGAARGAEKSDILNTLNLASASGAGPAPRLLSSEAVVGWQPSSGEEPAARQRSSRIILTLLAVVAAVCVVVVLAMTKKPKPLPPTPPSKTVTDPLAGVVDNQPPAAAQPPAPSGTGAPGTAPEAPSPPAAPASSSSHGRGKGHTGPHGKGAAAATSPPPLVAGAAPAVSAENSANARYRDTGRNLNITGGSGASRPPPSQSEITRVIHNNMGGIKNCYQRALLRDNSLTHGKITVQVSIGISGRVKHTSIDGPPQFRALDPCIKEVVGRWAFPQAGDEYGTEFVYVFQGNE